MLLAAGSDKSLSALVWQTGKHLRCLLGLTRGLQALQRSTARASLDTCLSSVHVCRTHFGVIACMLAHAARAPHVQSKL